MTAEALRRRLKQSEWIVSAEALRILDEPDRVSSALAAAFAVTAAFAVMLEPQPERYELHIDGRPTGVMLEPGVTYRFYVGPAEETTGPT